MARLQQQEQKITVRPDTLPNLLADIAKGTYRIPQFQREFVWNTKKIMDLFDSIYKEFPIGSLFFWKAGKEHNRLFRHTVNFDTPTVGDDDTISFILDGQQRCTALYVTLNGLTVNETDYSRLCFDLQKEEFVERNADDQRYVSLSTLWGANAMMLSQQLPREHLPSYIQCWQTLRTYPLSMVEVRDKDLAEVCKIFQRINQGGKRLNRFDLIAATTFTPGFDLRERFKKDVTKPLKASKFGEIAPTILTQMLALNRFGGATEKNEFSLTADMIKADWKNAVDSVLLAADTLRKSVGVIDSKFVPYDAILTLVGYYFLKSGKRALSAEHMDWMQRWFWRSSFGNRFAGAAATKLGQDKELFDSLIAGTIPEYNQPVQLTPASLVRVRMTQSGSAVRNAFLCLLATLQPRHYLNNTQIDLLSGSMSRFSSREKHHVFPTAYLSENGPPGANIHSLPNFCFVPAELNKQINNSDPATYVAKFRAANPDFDDAAQTHLLPTGLDSGIPENDYLRFLNARANAILEQIGRVCGDIIRPKEHERYRAIKELETRLRDLINSTLHRTKGESYWKQCVPPDVREAVKERINKELAVSRELKEADFHSPRRKLDYCDVMHYFTIIGNGANWPAFQAMFRKREDLQRYMSSLNVYRNAVMHNRPLTELERMNGEAALIWFANVLSAEDETSDSNAAEDGDDE
jgi:hypothetical protein